jgi:DNA N-6-adenine-methyltransferase (Dam)
LLFKDPFQNLQAIYKKVALMNKTDVKRVHPSKDKWVVPKELLNALGKFDQDVYAPYNRPWDSATAYYTIIDDGLNQNWTGRVFCHPPNGKQTYDWLERCAKHGNAIALVYAKTDAKYFQDIVLKQATAVLFIKGRVKFHYTDGNKADSAPLPSLLVAFDQVTGRLLEESGIGGSFLWLKNSVKNAG